MTQSLLSTVLRRDDAIVVSALLLLTLLAWAGVLGFAEEMRATMPGMTMQGMESMPGMAMMAPAFPPWTAAHFGFLFAMWVVMMVGMMTPSAAPMILLYDRVARQARATGRGFSSAGWFAGGYLLCWVGFALAATAAQYALERAALMTPDMTSANRMFGGLVLVAAGLFQWTPWKAACLAQCRSPLSFIERHGGFRPGVAASLRLGVLHGAYCVGCCGALMALLFVVGVMNLLWIATLMIFVLAEKIVPFGRTLSRLAGVAAIIAGAALLIR